jgi:D-beta-D-heptose 7-phosphate kinase / D-beta-D-heptose 1-phosphate adenosyltransferase
LNKGIEFNICIISDYGKGTLKDLAPITKYLLDNKVKILVDLKDSNIEKYDGVYLIKQNLKEFKNFLSAEKITLENESIENLRDAAVSPISQTNVENILITLNHRGSLFVTCDGSYGYYHQDEVKISDVTGAGDHVLAFLALGLLREHNLNMAIKLAIQAAIIAVQKFGTEPVFEIELPMKNLSYDISVNEKLRLIKQMRLGDQKIVFTNGCFDILHIGHLDLLRKLKD